MSHICVRDLKDFEQVGDLLYGEKFGFYERCIHEKQHGSITFDDFVLLHLSKY